jgi:hypothetical protein
MSSCNFEGGRVIVDESGLDERSRSLVEFAADLLTPLPMTRPARPDENGIIERQMAADVSPALMEKVAEIALRGTQA